MATQLEAMSYLDNCGKHVSQVQAAQLTIGRETWLGAAYLDSNAANPNENSPRYYFLGVMPKRTPRNTVYKIGTEVYYIAGYYQEDKPHPMQPLGKTFLLFRWPTEEIGAIDRYEKYTFIPAELS